LSNKELVELAECAVRTWGYESQINMMIEECAECIQALVKLKRKQNGTTIFEAIGEFVDVEIMLTQMKVMFPNPAWLSRRYDKIQRLKRLLDEANKEIE
jgi:hypothetical protein